MTKKIASPQINDDQPKTLTHYTNDVVTALSYIPADIDYESWFRIAAALKNSGCSFNIFDSWSSASDKYDSRKCKSTWDGIKHGRGINIGTLFFYAKRYGYKPIHRHSIPDVVTAFSEYFENQTDPEVLIKQQGDAAETARKIFQSCIQAPSNHPYLVKKRIKTDFMVAVNSDNELVIPVRDLELQLHSLHFISPKGDKRFLTGGAIKGHCCRLSAGDDIVISEGFATGMTLSTHYMPNSSVYVAFNAGNLLPVALTLRAVFPDVKIIIAGDFDRQSGTGQRTALDAAKAVNGIVAIPSFSDNELGSDWNDRWLLDNAEVSS